MLLAAGTLHRRSDAWRALADTMAREGWTQQRVLSLFMDAVTLLQAETEASPAARQVRGVIAEAVCTALSLEDLADSLESLGPILQDSASSQTADHGDVARRIAQYLRERYGEHINNQTLALAFGYVPSYISLLFRRAYGVSPAEYLTEVRMAEAKRLMHAHPGMLVREVAEAVGFKSQHHFSRIFKKNEGVWPTGYQT